MTWFLGRVDNGYNHIVVSGDYTVRSISYKCCRYLAISNYNAIFIGTKRLHTAPILSAIDTDQCYGDRKELI